MFNSDPPTSPAAADQAVEEIVAQGPSGAIVLAGIATAWLGRKARLPARR